MALGIALRAPVKTCWKATQFLPPRPACPRPAELFHGLPATDDWRLLCARATGNAKLIAEFHSWQAGRHADRLACSACQSTRP